MLAKLAFGNLRRNLRDHALYFVTIMLGVTVFYAFNTIDEQTAFLDESLSETLQLIGTMLSGATVLLAVVLGFLMVYANNYLVKRRKKEFGTYLLLGMRRTQLAGIIAIETAVIGLGAYVVGLVLGCLLSQFLIFVTATIFHQTVTDFHFLFSMQGLVYSAICFGATFVLTLVLNVFSCGRVKIADLMTASRKNERTGTKPLWISIPLVVLGVALIVCAYLRLDADGFPQVIGGPEMRPFAITTGLMVAGTVSFLFGLPACVLALVKLVRPVYYRGLTMVTVREIASRLNRASMTMVVTCLVLFVALCCGVGGFSLCIAMNESVETTSPFGASVSAWYGGGQSGASDTSDWYETVEKPVDLATLLESTVGYRIPANATTTTVCVRNSDDVTYGDLASASNELPEELEYFTDSPLNVMAWSDYAAVCRQLGAEPVELAEGRYLISVNTGTTTIDFLSRAVAGGTTVTLSGHELTPAGVVTGVTAAISNSVYGNNSGTLVVADDIADKLPIRASYLNIYYPENSETMQEAFTEVVDDYEADNPNSVISVLSDGRTVARPYSEAPDELLASQPEGTRIVGEVDQYVTRLDAAFASYQMTGIVAYLAVYLGFVLTLSVASVLAIQQVTGVSEAGPRYALLYDLGVSRARIARSVAIQTAVYFLVPLALALAHASVALSVLDRLVAALVPLDFGPKTLVVGGLFLAVYAAYMAVCWGLSKAAVDSGLSAGDGR
jgi:putative ABC transport system permease protein